MTESFSTLPLRVNADRMSASFIHLASIGATGDGGVSRVTFSEEHLAKIQKIQLNGLKPH